MVTHDRDEALSLADRIVSSGSLLGSSQGVVVSQPVLDAIAANGNSLLEDEELHVAA